MSTGLHSDNGVEAAMLNIRSITQYNTGDATVKAFAANLFSEMIKRDLFIAKNKIWLEPSSEWELK
ncbi:MAG: hypothetical protein R3A44_10080 [Caldilineaceae bacterium]